MAEIKIISKEKQLPKVIRVAAYARVSSDKDAMLHSLSSQVSYFSKMIQSHDSWRYVGVYSDEGIIHFIKEELLRTLVSRLSKRNKRTPMRLKSIITRILFRANLNGRLSTFIPIKEFLEQTSNIETASIR